MNSPQQTVAKADIPLVDLKAQYRRIKKDVHARIDAVLEHGRFILGPEVQELENELASFAGCAEALGVSSGTDALLLALMAESIGPGDAVFLPAFTFTASAEVILMVGATPVFVDVDEGTFNIATDDLEKKIGETKSATELTPRAIIAVDLFGLPADYRALAEVAQREGLYVLADAAQSFGGSLDGTKVGMLAPVTATSFFPAKPLGCYGDGGALLTDDPQRAEQFRSLRAHGKGNQKYDIVRIGLNARLDTLQAAIVLAKLQVFAEEITAREALAARYDAWLGKDLAIPARPVGAKSAWAQYTIKLERRDEVAAAMRQQGIPSAIYYPLPMHLQPAYAGYGKGPGSLPVSEKLSLQVLSLPMHPYLDEATAKRICEVVLEAVSSP
ncbi:MAG TPA: DegT/DnrJ/EryC1/StrS family aminotransferase [Alphaproteobacteria bacterium]|jgi:dTDP-4-amino-4,6-dideoxygalactose transaminase|nr:DegT/DnrJ/EryC1/StrS family aminotransferase [Alphaproteobacteria bacterium]